jgi:hypothetical protein
MEIIKIRLTGISGEIPEHIEWIYNEYRCDVFKPK